MNEVRTLHGVTAGCYTFTHGRNPTPQNNERNALAFLLTIPWTTEFWPSEGGLPMYGTGVWRREQTARLLLSAQAVIPSMSASKLSGAIQILAQSQPRKTPPRAVLSAPKSE